MGIRKFSVVSILGTFLVIVGATQVWAGERLESSTDTLKNETAVMSSYTFTSLDRAPIPSIYYMGASVDWGEARFNISGTYSRSGRFQSPAVPYTFQPYDYRSTKFSWYIDYTGVNTNGYPNRTMSVGADLQVYQKNIHNDLSFSFQHAGVYTEQMSIDEKAGWYNESFKALLTTAFTLNAITYSTDVPVDGGYRPLSSRKFYLTWFGLGGQFEYTPSSYEKVTCAPLWMKDRTIGDEYVLLPVQYQRTLPNIWLAVETEVYYISEYKEERAYGGSFQLDKYVGEHKCWLGVAYDSYDADDLDDSHAVGVTAGAEFAIKRRALITLAYNYRGLFDLVLVRKCSAFDYTDLTRKDNKLSIRFALQY